MDLQETVCEPQTTDPVHVVFLHNKFKKRYEDRYIVDMANALQEHGHQVSIYTSELDEENSFEELYKSTGNLHITYCGWWLPRNWKYLKSILMALRLVMFPPTPTPTVVIMDVDTIALYILSFFASRLIYVSHFTTLHHADIYTKFIKITPDLTSAKALKYADEIIVHSEGLSEVFHRSFPMVPKDLRVVHPCVDTGLWKEEVIDIERIVPDLPKPHFLFVCFGCYKKRSNFKMVLQSFEDLLLLCAPNMKENVHLVIAGHCSETQQDQQTYYKELVDSTLEKCFASQVTFLKQLPTVYRKTLIQESIAVLLPCKYELFPEMVLAVMGSNRPVIAANSGFPKEALRHRISGILVDPTPHMFATAMYKILTNPTIQVFLSDMAHEQYMRHYSYAAFKKKINGIVRQSAEMHAHLAEKLKNL